MPSPEPEPRSPEQTRDALIDSLEEAVSATVSAWQRLTTAHLDLELTALTGGEEVSEQLPYLQIRADLSAATAEYRPAAQAARALLEAVQALPDRLVREGDGERIARAQERLLQGHAEAILLIDSSQVFDLLGVLADRALEEAAWLVEDRSRLGISGEAALVHAQYSRAMSAVFDGDRTSSVVELDRLGEYTLENPGTRARVEALRMYAAASRAIPGHHAP